MTYLMKGQEIVAAIVEELLRQFGLEGTVQVVEIAGGYRCDIESPDSALLIGWRGGTLAAFEYIVRLLMMHQFDKAGEPMVEVHLDIGGYRQRQTDELIELAKTTAKGVLEQQESQILRPMNAYERRIVHMALAELDAITTESIGVEPNRRIMIKPNF